MEKPLLNSAAFVKGLLSGGLLASSFILGFDLFFRFGIFIFGFLVILDSILPSKEEADYPLLALIGFGLGVLVSVLFNITGSDIYSLIILVVSALFYLYKAGKSIGLIRQ